MEYMHAGWCASPSQSAAPGLGVGVCACRPWPGTIWGRPIIKQITHFQMIPQVSLQPSSGNSSRGFDSMGFSTWYLVQVTGLIIIY